MNNARTRAPQTRREFIRSTGGAGIGLMAFSGFVPAFLARAAAAEAPAAGKDRSILVIVQLAGGNDGLNTLIPNADDNYYRLRPRLGLREGLHAINDTLSMHPACGPMAELHREGKLAIVQNVGYPNPNRSHFRSMEIWETASASDEYARHGWLGRYFDNACAGAPREEGEPLAVHLGDEVPQSFFAGSNHNIFGLPEKNRRGDDGDEEALRALVEASPGHAAAGYLQHAMMDALVTEDRLNKAIRDYKSPVEYPRSGLSRSLRKVAGLITAGLDTRVYFVSQGGYDTHANQLGSHHRNLEQLSEALAAFQRDLRHHKLEEQVLTMTFSEFGRRPAENGSGGTDHGTAAPLFVMGGNMAQPVCGSAPSLELEPRQDLAYSTDFRQVYATVLERWLGTAAGPVLGGQFSPLPFLA